MPGIDPMEEVAKSNLPDDGVLQHYPSPVADSQEGNALYATNHAEPERQESNGYHEKDEQRVTHEHSTPLQVDGHEHQHQHQHQHDSDSTPSHSTIIPMTSAEELRIAAQLSQDLSQGISSILEPNDHHTNNHVDDPNLHSTIAHHETDESQRKYEAPREQGREQSHEQHQGRTHEQNHEQHHDQHSQHGQEAVEQLAQVLQNGHQDDQHMDHPMSNSEHPADPTREALNQTHHQASPPHTFVSEEQRPHDERQYLSDQQQGQQENRHQNSHHGDQMHGILMHDQQATQHMAQRPQPGPPSEPSQHSQSQTAAQPQNLQQPGPLQQPQPLQQSHPTPLQPHGALDHLPHQQYVASPQQNTQDNIPPRKRSKVSRACDECRRKKVKCDASSETGEEPCSNCRRSSIQCLFSRIPQKRGPSKGYIKELADRIHHIEGKLASEGSLDALTELLGGSRRESSDLFASSGQQEESRKRPFSSMSGNEFGSPNTPRPSNWASEPRPIQPYQTPSNEPRGSPYSANGLAPQPIAKPDADISSRAATSLEDVPLDLNGSNPPKELIIDSFGVYLNVVHQCFPLLAGNKGRVEAQLARCPPLLQDAFIEAFYGTMQSCVSAPGLYTNGDIGSATRMVAEWESDHTSPRNALTNLVHLQALVLMAIGTDNYGPPSLKGEHGGPSKASILGRAVGLAYSMRLHIASSGVSTDSDQDTDSDMNIAVRTWWTLVMLDRWNAISTGSPLFIPNDSVVILPALVPVLGENVYHLARLSNIIGHFAPVSLAPPQALIPDASAAPTLNSFFNLSIELFREVLPSNITPTTHPILNLAYWHSRLLAYLFQTNAKSKDVIWATKKTAGLLLSNTALLSPLNHHFFGLATLALLELVKLEGTREEVDPLLKDLLERNLAPSTWDGVIRGRITDVLRDVAAQSTADKSLPDAGDTVAAKGPDTDKHGQDAGSERLRTSTTYSDLGFDPRPILHLGYLNVLAKGLPTNRPQ
ncbi:hypothetical protein GGS20DRAFT_212425 [Poronia punctata]|nr:hypothetical protein GGS20DRAFT_212425 [Poronia punctata]